MGKTIPSGRIVGYTLHRSRSSVLIARYQGTKTPNQITRQPLLDSSYRADITTIRLWFSRWYYAESAISPAIADTLQLRIKERSEGALFKSIMARLLYCLLKTKSMMLIRICVWNEWGERQKDFIDIMSFVL